MFWRKLSFTWCRLPTIFQFLIVWVFLFQVQTLLSVHSVYTCSITTAVRMPFYSGVQFVRPFKPQCFFAICLCLRFLLKFTIVVAPDQMPRCAELQSDAESASAWDYCVDDTPASRNWYQAMADCRVLLTRELLPSSTNKHATCYNTPIFPQMLALHTCLLTQWFSFCKSVQCTRKKSD